MAHAEFTRSGVEVDTTYDDIIIRVLLEDIPGGRTLNTEGIDEDVIKAGRVIIEEDSTGELKPLKIEGDNYASLPGGHSYKGILYRTILKRLPLAPIMVRGGVNEEAAKNYGLPAYPGGAKTALSLINFTKD